MTSGPANRPTQRRRLLWLIPVISALSYAIVAVFLGATLAKTMPGAVLKLYPQHAPSLVNAANNALTGSKGPSSLDRAQGFARAAVRASAVSPDALRTLAILERARGRDARAGELLLASQRLTRRDLSTTVLLIEEFVRRNDVPGALRQYDFALRTSRQAPAILFPNLFAASNNAWIRPEITKILARDPAWSDAFSAQLIDSDVTPEIKVRLAQDLAGRRWFGEPFRNAMTARLVRDESFALAARLAGVKTGYDPALRTALAVAPESPAFAWKLANGYSVESDISIDAGRQSLEVRLDPEFRDSPARLLTMLPPGTYRLSSALAKAEGDVEAAWAVRCAAPSRADLVRLLLTTAADNAVVFAVPSDCAAQWLELTTSPGPSSSGDLVLEIKLLSLVPAE